MSTRTSSDRSTDDNSSGPMPRRDVTSMTRVRPSSISSGSASVPAALSKKCRGASTCVPVWALRWSAETLELSPLAIRFVGSRLNGTFPG